MNTTVERCELAANFSISRVLTGLWQIADMERDGASLNPEATAALMTPYADAGFTTFDMADHYGSAEIIAGRFRQMRDPDKPVQLLTKWVPTPGPVTRDEVRAAVQRRLDRLQTDAIDLLQFHAWNYADPRWLDCLFWLQEFKEQQLIRHLGLTNFDTAHLRIVVNSGIDVVSNQVCFSLIDQRPRQRMTELCLQHNIKLLCYGTVAGGFLSARWLGKPEPDESALGNWSQMKYKRFIDAAGGWEKFQHLLSAVDEIARRCNVSIANIACRYILEQPAVGGVIIGARLGERQHVDENLRLFQFTLDETSRAAITAAITKLHSIAGDCGDEYRQPPFLTASGDLSHHLDSMPPPYVAQTAANGRSKILSGTVWEDLAGFCRAVRIGNRICISGTTATHGHRAIGGADAAAQLHFIIDKVEGAMHSLGGRLEHVVRTRLFVRNLADWEAVARAHGERFRGIQPANTLVQAGLVGEEYLVEMEVEAVVDGEAD
jgi:aryl-alcohol dehydrogenase-like predicted oxidoreductase/enamine deaminase RidA (YjgF/YER057c/UK114 family)